MTRKKRRKPQHTAPTAPPAAPAQAPVPRKYAWIPVWGWVLIFALPLITSELMFYAAGRWASMILFPVVWIGFWAAILWRTDWAILKRQRTR
jgi:hypothetical protein